MTLKIILQKYQGAHKQGHFRRRIDVNYVFAQIRVKHFFNYFLIIFSVPLKKKKRKIVVVPPVDRWSSKLDLIEKNDGT